MATTWDAAGVMRRLDMLAGCTDCPGEITRLFLSPAHRAAVALVGQWMAEAGLTTFLDASGTVVGRLPGVSADAPTLLLGSHIDTVRNAGRYDGCLGVIMAIALAARFGRNALPFTLEIRAFGDEEGVRFPITLTSAHAAAGSFDPVWLDAKDQDGETLRQALCTFGLSPDALAHGACTGDIFAYLEMHIEQGPVLEMANARLGIVTAINGAARYAVTVVGCAGHAGTVPMAERRDALVAAAAMVLATDGVARKQQDVVATIGHIAVLPGAANVIPGDCRFTIDLRAPQDTKLVRAEQEIRDALDEIARVRSVTVAMRRTHSAPAVACDTRLQTLLAFGLTALKYPVIHLPSGAGHDAMVLASRCPIGMLFIRCRGGISHHPDEQVSETDVAAGLEVMARVLNAIEPAEFC